MKAVSQTFLHVVVGECSKGTSAQLVAQLKFSDTAVSDAARTNKRPVPDCIDIYRQSMSTRLPF